MKRKKRLLMIALMGSALFFTAAAPCWQNPDPDPPDEVVKLIFIHHSTGENWLADSYGDLGSELGRSNYFVSDTNYGWGPDYIGDNTDIPLWIKWFRSPQTPNYMDALFNESGQHSSYTRSLSDPGGENQIIMFKSCFPNSELTGSPNDPPGMYEDLSVGGAKYVYNQLLQYFAARPDKLFVVITAPPLSDQSYAKNARAFNLWLVNDWLDESNYSLNNVAVFDFYNVLTASNAHHRYQNGQIEHVVSSSNTLHYPTGDDHPSAEGSRKATEEFVPLLNIFFNSFKENAPLQPPVESSAPEPAQDEQTQVEAQPPAPAAQPASAGLIDNFETDNPPGTNGWEPFWDEATPTSIHCAVGSETVYSGARSLALDFDIAPNAWATCALFYDSTQNLSGGEGLTFYLHAAQPGLVFDVDIYSGSRDSQETYLYTIETPADSASGWVPISLNWSDFHRADWEEGAGEPFTKPDQIVGLAFGMSTYPDTPNTGSLWVDDLALLGQETTQTAPQQAAANEEEEEPETSRGLQLPCGTAFALPIFLISTGMLNRKRK
jgi:hypothetical protein